MSSIIIVGAGLSGLSAAAYLSAAGHAVQIFEKNAVPGGRARQLHTAEGYTFDMGPSWYWMPGVFEDFFRDFGYSVAELYDLKLLDPSFEVVFPKGHSIRVPADFDHLCILFETIEKGSSGQLIRFMDEAGYKYAVGMKKLGEMPGLSLREFLDRDLIGGLFRLQVFSSFSKHVRKYFTDPRLIALMEFPVLFLGAMPQEMPALYSLMNYAGFRLGTWYPMGGFGKVIEAMVKVVESRGVKIHLNTPVDRIITDGQRATGVVLQGRSLSCDGIIATADYHHVESQLLPASFRNYPESYWEGKTFAPSCLIFYIGLNRKITRMDHHTLFFDADMAAHSQEIYKTPQWPTKPLFYVCCPSRTDSSVAPEGHENLFFLMPLAPGLEDSEALREKYFDLLLRRFETHIGEAIASAIDYKRSYCIRDFVSDYNAYKGNAYGLANTLSQTAILKPGIKNKKLKNLFYAGQLTVPGPGVPPSLISGKIAATEMIKYLKKMEHEVGIR